MLRRRHYIWLDSREVFNDMIQRMQVVLCHTAALLVCVLLASYISIDSGLPEPIFSMPEGDQSFSPNSTVERRREERRRLADG